MPELVYEAIPAFNREEIEYAIEFGDPDELSIIVLSVALNADEPDWAESICVQLANHPHFNVRANALLAFAHLARIHGNLNAETVKPLIEKGLDDINDYVRNNALDTKEDIEHFLGWEF